MQHLGQKIHISN